VTSPSSPSACRTASRALTRTSVLPPGERPPAPSPSHQAGRVQGNAIGRSPGSAGHRQAMRRLSLTSGSADPVFLERCLPGRAATLGARRLAAGREIIGMAPGRARFAGVGCRPCREEGRLVRPPAWPAAGLRSGPAGRAVAGACRRDRACWRTAVGGPLAGRARTPAGHVWGNVQLGRPHSKNRR
jgi:hypothetical protein